MLYLELIVRCQDVKAFHRLTTESKVQLDARVKVYLGTIPWNEVYATGDVAIDAEKFNGLSLPLQEARAAGLLVMTTNRFPANMWLPNDSLIPVEAVQKACVAGSCLEFEESIVDPKAIANKMDDWYGRDITDYSMTGSDYAKVMSWDTFKPIYMKALSS